MRSLSNEQELILLCSRGVLSLPQQERVREILADNVDWKEILFQGVTHRILNLVYFQVKSLGLLDTIEQEIRKLMEINYKAIGLKNRIYLDALKDISDAFRENGIKAVILKGILLAPVVYPAIETRYFNDIDFLVKKQDISKLTQVLNTLGFIQGDYDEQTGKIAEATRKQKMFHQMTTHELQEFVKVANHPFVQLIQVDVNHNILWVGNCPYEVDNELLIDRAVQTTINGNIQAYRLDCEDFIVQLCCHLYREATILHWIKDLKDLKIYKFADIVIYLEKYKNLMNWGKFLSYVKENKLEKIIYYVFHYVNLMYGDVVPHDVMQEIGIENKKFLDEYGIEGDIPSRWKCDFFTRLFDTNRVLEVYGNPNASKEDFFSLRNQLTK